MNIIHGDCLEVMRGIGENSIDSIVTDPPYGLAFMGKKWDYDVPSIEIWKEALRVLKPGGHLLSFGGTRTYHRLASAIEDAGFEIRDQLQWLFGSGFPKSLDVSKAIDKAAGAEREVVGVSPNWRESKRDYAKEEWEVRGENAGKLTTPSTDAAKQWQGFGTALKPANEPIVLARKPLSEKTVAANVLKWGTGGINVDGCRIEASDQAKFAKNWDRETQTDIRGNKYAAGTESKTLDHTYSAPQGRFPSNLLLDETAAEMLDAQSGSSKSSGGHIRQSGSSWKCSNQIGTYERILDSGGASRFFYCAKSSKRERNEGLEGMPEVAEGVGDERPSGQSMQRLDGRETRKNQNHHPTVKPITLMRYLCRLITPPGGVVLDPFAGSGSTGVAAIKEGFKFVGIERELQYIEIAMSRMRRGVE